MRKRNVLHSPRLLELKRKRRMASLNKVLFFLFGTGVVVVAIFYILRIDRLNIQSVTVEGNKIIDANAIIGITNAEMSGNYIWVVPKSNIFFYPKNKIRESLEERFRRLTDIEIGMGNGAVLDIKVRERVPKYTWCGNELSTEVDNLSCYFLDENGYIFDEAPYFSGGVYFKFYGSVDPDEDPSGNYFFKEDFANLLQFKTIIEDMELSPISIYVSGGDDEGKMQLAPSGLSGTTPEIIFKLDADMEKIAENFQSALATDPLKVDFKKKYSSLLYIDLRFGNKVYYKFRE